MPDYKLNIIGTFNNKQLVKALKEAGVNVDRLKKKAKEAEVGMSGFRNATAGLRRTMGAIRNNLLLVSFAFGGMGIAIKKATDDFVKFEQVKLGFDALTEAADLQGNVLDKLTEATDGTVTSAELMTQANNAMLLGIVDSTDQMADMFDIAQRLASAVGQDAAFGVQSLTTGMGRQSKLMLDNLGIIIDVNSAYEKHAVVLEKSASELTDAERKTAFINATMESATEKVEQLGKENLKQVDIMKQASVAWAEGSRSMGELLGPAVIMVAKAMKEFADRWKFAIDMLKDNTPIQEYVISLETLEEVQDRATRMMEKFGAKTGTLPKQMTSVGGAVHDTAGQMEFLINHMEEGNLKVKEGSEQWANHSKIIRHYKMVLEELKTAQAEVNRLEGEGADKKKKAVPALDDFTRRYREYVTEQSNAMQQQQDEALFVEMLTAQYEELATFLGLGYEGFAEKQLTLHENYTKEQEFIEKFIEDYPKVAKTIGLVTDATKEQEKADKEATKVKEEQMKMGMQGASKMASAMVVLAKGNKRQAEAALRISQGVALASAIEGSMKAFAKGGVGGYIMGTALFLEGLARIQQINKQISEIKSVKEAQFGLNEVVSSPTLILAGENNQAESVQITPLEGPNLEGPQGGGSITINISAPLVDESVVDHIIPAINEAVRRGETLHATG